MEDQHVSLDKISTLPQNIKETILCLLPLQEAARTSILSRPWRYIWATIPKLEFIEKDFQVPNDENQGLEVGKTYNTSRRRIFSAIYQVLLVHRGPIHSFSLSMYADDRCTEIDQILLHLSMNYNVKKLKLHMISGYKLPLSIFSMHQLTDLYISGCHLKYLEDTFNGFPRLTSLHLVDVHRYSATILRIICTSPLLKRVTLSTTFQRAYGPLNEGVGLTIVDLFKFLPMIEHIVISHVVIKACYDTGIPHELPYPLVHLKSFKFIYMNFSDRYGLPFLVLLIRCSPNLEKINLLICHDELDDDYGVPSIDYSDIRLEHLNELHIEAFTNLNNMEFLKHILATSPVLKKVSIVLDNKIDNDEELEILRILLRSPRTSPMVDIIVERPPS